MDDLTNSVNGRILAASNLSLSDSGKSARGARIDGLIQKLPWLVPSYRNLRTLICKPGAETKVWNCVLSKTNLHAMIGEAQGKLIRWK